MPDDIAENQNKIVLYSTENDNVNVDVYFQDETFWLTQKAMANCLMLKRIPYIPFTRNL
ncbi:MAG: hypothetical protein FWH37_07375 [Candidatus Bathyarchaeota archaeon]|nr:hypothetical protein [Candidatus Termiticorpusculum sp.]